MKQVSPDRSICFDNRLGGNFTSNTPVNYSLKYSHVIEYDSWFV